MSKKRVLIFSLVLSLIVILYLGYPFTLFFKIVPPFDRPIPVQDMPEGLESLSAESCGGCHIEIYEEWRTSMHSQAYVDPQFQAYFKKDGRLWVCLNCHTPLTEQQEFLVKDLRLGSVYRPVLMKNPDFDAELREEGLTCAACHVRDGIVYGPYEIDDAPHSTRYDPSFRTAEFCLKCKDAPGNTRTILNSRLCNTGLDWRAGPYAAQGVICQDCHMPRVERPLVQDEHEERDGKTRVFPVRLTGRHLWRGAHDPEMLKSAVTVKLEAPDQPLSPGEETTLYLNITNSGAGHELPTVDPGRYVEIVFEARSGQGRMLKRESYRIGRNIIWAPVLIELSDDRLGPLESRLFEFSFQAPEDGVAVVSVSVDYRFLSDAVKKRMKKYGLPDDAVASINIYGEDLRLEVG